MQNTNNHGKNKNLGPDEWTQHELGVQKYLTMSQVLSKCYSREELEPKSLADCNEIKVSALVQELNGMNNLEQPVFIKYMRKSQVSSTFLLRVPLPFSRRYLPMKDLIITLETESGKVYETKFLLDQSVFSAGWKRFAIAEKLVEGDHVVFHLLDVTRFKVYTIKKGSSTVKLPTHRLNLYEKARQGVAETAYADENKLRVYKRREMHKRIDTFNKTFRGEINNITRFNKFKTNISMLLQDQELSELSLHAYYELCRAQNAILHARLLKGLNPKFFHKAIKSTISNTIRICYALRTCTLPTFLDSFSEWNKTLQHYEVLGMNVGLLSARLDHLRNLAVSSDGAVSRNKYIEACCERPRCECEVKKLEVILGKLRKVSIMLESKVKVLESEAGWENYTEAYFKLTQVKDEIRDIEGLIADFGKFFEQYDVVIEALKSKAINHEHHFQEEARASW